MKKHLSYEVTIPNDCNEELQVTCETYAAETITLRIPGTKDYKSETITLTGEEFDRVCSIINTFRQMKGLSNETENTN